MPDKISGQLERILQSVADGITVQMPNGSIGYANAAAAEMLGSPSPDALVNQSLGELLEKLELLYPDGSPIPTEDLPGWKALRGQPTMEERLVLFRVLPDGEQRWLTIKADPVWNQQAEVQYVVNTFRDVTKQQQALIAEQEARKRAETSQQHLMLLGKISDVLSLSLDYETTLGQVGDLAVSVMADWCAVDLVQSDDTLQRVAVSHIDPSMVELAYCLHERYPPDPAAATGLYQVIRSGKSELYEQITLQMLEASARDDEHLSLVQQLNLSSMIIVPLKARDRVLGALTLASSNSGRRFTHEDVEMAEQLADRAALAVDNARLYREATEANEELEKHVAERTEQLREAQQIARLGSWTWDVASNQVQWSEELYNIYGLGPQEFDGTYEGFLNHLHPDDRSLIAATIETAYENHEPFVYYERIYQPSGAMRILYSQGYVETDEEGKVIRMSGTCQDVTQLKQTEQMLRSLLDLSEQLNATLDLDTVLETLTQEAIRLTGAESGFSGLNTGSELVTRYYYHQSEAILIDKLWSPDEGVPGWLVRHKQAYLSNEADKDPLVAPDLIERFDLKSILSIPILDTNGDVVGFFEVINKQNEEEFTSHDQEKLLNLAPIAAIAIENAQLYKRQRELSREVVTAQEEERRRLSRELHDSAGQLLTALTLVLSMLHNKPPAEVERLQERLKEAQNLALEAHEEIRAISHALRPAILDMGGLNDALENLCRDFGKRTSLEVLYEGTKVPHLSDQTRITFYRFLQETLSNVVRHARASRVHVRFQQQEQELSLTVTDNGIGFPNTQLRVSTPAQGVGLLGLKERFELIDGRVQIESHPGAGTRVTGRYWMDRAPIRQKAALP